MKLICGLGNPGEKYDGTKHNVGFDVVDQIVASQNLSLDKQKFQSDYTIWNRNGDKTILMKPYTYMNLSGEALLPMMSYYGIAMDDIVVVYDDLDLDPGKIRLRVKGSSGGHNGMKSIIHLLGSQEFKRIKLGIGRPDYGWKVVDHVLAPFPKDQRPLIDTAVDQAAQCLIEWAEGQSFKLLMNEYN